MNEYTQGQIKQSDKLEIAKLVTDAFSLGFDSSSRGDFERDAWNYGYVKKQLEQYLGCDFVTIDGEITFKLKKEYKP